MKPVLCLTFVLAAALSAVGQAPPPAPGAPPAAPGAPPAAPGAPAALNIAQETENLMNEAVRLFTEAKYQEALAKIAEAEKNLNNKPFEGILYAKGACFFNLNDYPKAIESLELYLKEFPQGASVIDVRMALGRAYLRSKQGDKGVPVLKEVVTASPEKKAEAGLIIADYYKTENKPDEALQILSAVIADGIRSPESIQAAMMASQLHVAAGKLEEASALMEKVRNFASGGDNMAQMNNIYLQLGDQMMEKKSYRDALNAYQLVRKKTEISRIVKEQITKLEGKLKVTKDQAMKDTLSTQLKATQDILAEIEKRTDYDASLYYRLGRCYFEMGSPATEGAQPDPSRLWQAVVAFDLIVNDFKEFPQRDRCMFGLIMVNASLKRIKEARALCEKYIENFPDGSELGTVSEMFGMLAYQSGDLNEARAAFEKATSFPKADKERLRLLSGTVLFEMQRFDEARVAFETLLTEFKDTTYKDEVLYRIALSYFYQNDYKNVTKTLNKYIEENPKGMYICDAKYRLTFILFQEGKKEKALEDLLKIIEAHPSDTNIGQVHALSGDIYVQKGDYDNAMKQFALAVDKAKTEDVLNYVQDQLTDLYVSNNEWKKLSDMWQRYYNTHKDNEDQALKAILWISRGMIKDQKPEDAQKLLAEHIKKRISNPANQQVEGLVQQLVTITAPKKRARSATPPPADTAAATTPAPAGDAAAKPADAAAAKPAETAPAAATPAPAPEVTFEEVEKKLEDLLTPEDQAMRNGTTSMRILFAKTMLARTMKLPDKASKFFNILIEVAKAEDLSPMLLATVGDNARQKGDFDKATACYVRLRDLFKDSEYSDGAPVGLGEIEFEKGNTDKALELFKAASEYQGSAYLLQATQGTAKCLFKLKKFDEATKLYEQIAQTKEWRGEATANALRMLGEIEAAQGKNEAAIAYFQRVFIAHQKWKAEMAKAYLGAAKSFIALGKREEAKKHLDEMLARKDIPQDLPEVKEAQRLVATL